MPALLRIAVIGPGKVAHLHAKAALQTPNTQLVAVYGRTFNKADDFARQYGIKAYTDVRDMVDGKSRSLPCLHHTPRPPRTNDSRFGGRFACAGRKALSVYAGGLRRDD